MVQRLLLFRIKSHPGVAYESFAYKKSVQVFLFSSKHEKIKTKFRLNKAHASFVLKFPLFSFFIFASSVFCVVFFLKVFFFCTKDSVSLVLTLRRKSLCEFMEVKNVCEIKKL